MNKFIRILTNSLAKNSKLRTYETRYFLGIEVASSKKGIFFFLSHTIPNITSVVGIVGKSANALNEERINAEIRILK